MPNYEPEVNDYVVWERETWVGKIKDEGWVYFKGDPVEPKKGFATPARYITIETGVRDKKECVYTSGKPMRHKKVHTLLLCNKENWNELVYVKNRRKDPDYTMYKSQDGRLSDY